MKYKFRTCSIVNFTKILEYFCRGDEFCEFFSVRMSINKAPVSIDQDFSYLQFSIISKNLYNFLPGYSCPNINFRSVAQISESGFSISVFCQFLSNGMYSFLMGKATIFIIQSVILKYSHIQNT